MYLRGIGSVITESHSKLKLQMILDVTTSFTSMCEEEQWMRKEASVGSPPSCEALEMC